MAARVRRVSFATYNVLAPPLCTEECYVLCTRDALDSESRFERLCGRLEDPMADLSVIALQEVTLEWVTKLREWFHPRGYTFLVHLYYKERYGHMGVGIAFPHAVYELAEDTKDIGPQGFRPLDPLARLCTDDRSRPFHQLRDEGSTDEDEEDEEGETDIVKRQSTPPPQTVWDEARSKVNGMLMFSLRRRGNAPDPGFLVATYHMPCAFAQQQIMMIHGMAAMHAVQARASRDGIPFVFLGDFNTRPHDPLYVFYTHSCFPMKFDHQPPLEEGGDDSWPHSAKALDRFFPLGSVKSAYASIHGKEPDFTNHSFMAWKDQRPDAAFTDTLDYIFFSTHWEVISAPVLPCKDSLITEDIRSFPTVNEPSDHLMVQATATLR